MGIQTIISGQNSQTKQARNSFFREFDVAMQLANHRDGGSQFQQHLAKMEQYGSAAGVAANEIAYRRQTLLYSLTQGTRR